MKSKLLILFTSVFIAGNAPAKLCFQNLSAPPPLPKILISSDSKHHQCGLVDSGILDDSSKYVVNIKLFRVYETNHPAYDQYVIKKKYGMPQDFSPGRRIAGEYSCTHITKAYNNPFQPDYYRHGESFQLHLDSGISVAYSDIVECPK